jgi:hypothetical protein
MSTIKQIETAILTLALDELQRLRQWFSDVDYQRWDEQLERDVSDIKLEVLAEEAIAAFKRLFEKSVLLPVVPRRSPLTPLKKAGLIYPPEKNHFNPFLSLNLDRR